MTNSEYEKTCVQAAQYRYELKPVPVDYGNSPEGGSKFEVVKVPVGCATASDVLRCKTDGRLHQWMPVGFLSSDWKCGKCGIKYDRLLHVG